MGHEDASAESSTDGFETWVAARGPALQRFAHLVTGSAHDAPDLVQEALVSAYPRWAGLTREGTAEAYVRRSIVNASISRWRKAHRVVSADPATFTGGGESAGGDSVGDHAVALSDADEAWQLCRELPATQRAAVVLRFYEDLSFAQIALILDCTESTARSHVHRALAALRACLTESETSHD